jgi:uncharacterized protein YndB with AHSA1/START domain
MPTTHSGKATVTVQGDREIVIEREFDAPARLVWRAVTEPELVSRWWVGQRGQMTECEIDLRVGGRWRYAMTAHGGFEVAFTGEYREIATDERIVHTEVFEAMPGEPSVVEVAFTENGDRTTLSMLSTYDSTATRDAVIESGMEGGMQEGMDILEQVAISLAD